MNAKTNRSLECYLALLLAGASASAAATETSDSSRSFYSMLRIGAHFVEDSDGSLNSTRFFRPGSGEFDSGVTAGISMGIELKSVEALPAPLRHLRLEAEFAYDQNDFDVANSDNAELTASRFMANVYRDFELKNGFARLRPYIGAGVGAAIIEADGIGLSGNDDTVFAYQTRAGIAYRLKPDMDIHVGYRFLDTENPTFRYALGDFQTEYRSHSAELGFQYSF